MAEKSKDAFRTISEVAEWLDVPTHVLRFWESRFSQIKPVKRAGGRRYYRPSDMRVIGGVKVLLHDQGMTIRGVQKLFREEGIKHVSEFSPALFDSDGLTPAAPVLDEAALEIAARPAPAARATHSASPDPVEEPVVPASDEDAEQPPLFRRASTPPPATEEPTPELLAETAADAGPTAAIPATPDVPETDPGDDSPAHAREAGIAAHLKVADRQLLLRHRETLAEAATRLRAVLDKAS
ncbi:MAG: MerR family transcriptional regulator [Paracoccaceae bacterium]|nr:MerR family transcriptional regulator [Paracoccaceae bacterium]